MSKVDRVIEAVRDYLDGYEFRGEGGDYTPNEFEQVMIEDAVWGVLSTLEMDGLAIFNPNANPKVVIGVEDGRSTEHVRRS